MPHVPLFCSDKFKGKSGAGLYGDVMMEIDWSVGEIMKALQSAGVEDNTLVIFTSDNGPWTSYGNHAGKTPYREAKGTGFDGGTRSACIMRYPGQDQGRNRSRSGPSAPSTCCRRSRSWRAPKLPKNPIDGKNVWDLITGKPGATNPHDYYPFSTGAVFEGVISGDGRWKLHLPHSVPNVVETGNDGAAGKYRQEQIELRSSIWRTDPFETTNVIDKFPRCRARA